MQLVESQEAIFGKSGRVSEHVIWEYVEMNMYDYLCMRDGIRMVIWLQTW